VRASAFEDDIFGAGPFEGRSTSCSVVGFAPSPNSAADQQVVQLLGLHPLPTQQMRNNDRKSAAKKKNNFEVSITSHMIGMVLLIHWLVYRSST
jgi:hypothetical protein